MDKDPAANGNKPAGKSSVPSAKESLKQKFANARSEVPVASTSSKMDSTDHMGLGAESGPTPSLLEEVLAEKKLALMRSPEVVKFLQTQQERVGSEKRLMTITHNAPERDIQPHRNMES